MSSSSLTSSIRLSCSDFTSTTLPLALTALLSLAALTWLTMLLLLATLLLRTSPDEPILTSDCECCNGGCGGDLGCWSMVTTTVGGVAAEAAAADGCGGIGAVTARSRTTLVVVVVVLFPGTLPFSSVMVVFLTLMVTVLMFMAAALGLMGTVDDLETTCRPPPAAALEVRPAPLLDLDDATSDCLCCCAGDGPAEGGLDPDLAPLAFRLAGVDGDGAALDFVFAPDAVFFKGDFNGLEAGAALPPDDFSTFKLADDLWGTTGGVTGSGSGCCVGDSGTDVLLPTERSGLAPGILIGDGALLAGPSAD